MNEYTVIVERHYSYEVTIKADTESQAVEQVRDFEIEDLEPFEVDAWFTFTSV